MVGLVGFFVKWYINICRLFNAKVILLEEQLWCYLTHSWKDKGVHTFPKGICPKVTVRARVEYELAYYDSAVNRFNHYTTRTPPNEIEYMMLANSDDYDMRVTVIPIVVSALGTVTKGSEKRLEQVEIRGRIKNI